MGVTFHQRLLVKSGYGHPQRIWNELPKDDAFNLHNFGLSEIELKLVGKDRAEQPNETIRRKYKTGELDNFEKLLVLSY